MLKHSKLRTTVVRAVLVATGLMTIVGCRPPTNAFVIQSECPVDVYFDVTKYNASSGWGPISPDGTAVVRTRIEYEKLEFVVRATTYSGFPPINRMVFNVSDLTPEADGTYRLLIDSDCQAVIPTLD